MEYFKDLNYKNFIELIDYLESLSESKEEKDINFFVSERIKNFFPNLNALQDMELSYIISTKDEHAFEAFKADYPEIKIDPTGRSTSELKDIWSVKEKSLNTLFDMSIEFLKENNYKDKSKNKVNSQVFNAKTLAPLLNREFPEDVPYAFLRHKLILKHPNSDLVTLQNFKMHEEMLEELGYDYSSILYPVIKYILNKKHDNFEIFLDHTFGRIELLFQDKELKSESNKMFKNKLELLIKKNK